MKFRTLLLVLLSLATMSALAQKKFTPAPTFLKGEKEINVLFDYSDVKYDKESQESYYKSKSSAWIEEWEGKRRENNEGQFISYLNDEFRKLNINAGNYPEAKYTMIVEVRDCDFGAFAGPFSVPAKLTCMIRMVETGTTIFLSSLMLKESQNPYTVIGTPIDFDRIFLAFGEVGEGVGEKLYKILK